MPKLKDMAIAEFVDLLEQKQFKKKLIKKLNKSVDLPMFDEKTEKKVFDAMYDLILSTLSKLDDSDEDHP